MIIHGITFATPHFQYKLVFMSKLTSMHTT